MKHEKLSQALNEVRDQYIEEAAKKKRRNHAPWLGAVAAVLALVILAGIFLRPHSPQTPAVHLETAPTESVSVQPPTLLPPITTGLPKYQIAKPMYPTMLKYPTDSDSLFDEYDAWRENVNAIHNQPQGYGDVMQDYFKTVTPALLTDSDSTNPVCSPVNIYMALAMLAETADGETRQELLDFLGADTIEQLRTLCSYIWNGHYWDDGATTSILGNSLWLDDQYTFDLKCAERLAQYYYASSFSGDLGTEEMNKALQNWLNEQTGGLLEEHANAIELDPLSVFALASTIYYKVNWSDWFIAEHNTEQTFHGKNQAITATFMNQTLGNDTYYWGDNYGAVSLDLKDNSQMWLILPDEGTDINSVLQSNNLWSMISTSSFEYENQKQMKINLSVPKFKVDASMELKNILGDLGLTNTMSGTADFSNLAPDKALTVGSVTHAATVEINEEGVAAAAFTFIMEFGAVMPSENEIDFVLDRPFIFIIQSSDGLPLFAGVVNQL